MQIVPSRMPQIPWSRRIGNAALGGAIGTVLGALLLSCGGAWWWGTLAGVALGLEPIRLPIPVIR